MDLKIASEAADGTLRPILESAFVDGESALLQQLWIELVSDFNDLLSRGAGLRRIIDEADPTNQRALLTSITRCFNIAKTHILEQQRTVGTIPDSGRLRDLVLDSVRVVEANPLRVEISATVTTAKNAVVRTFVL